MGDLQFDIFRVIQELEKIIELLLHEVIVYQSGHRYHLITLMLQVWISHELIMLSKHGIHVHFLKVNCQILCKTYLLGEILNKRGDGLYIFCLCGYSHHSLHLRFHLRKVSSRSKNTNEQNIFHLGILKVIRLQFLSLFFALIKSSGHVP